MRNLTKSLHGILLATLIIILVSCNTKNADELIVGKWKCTNVEIVEVENQQGGKEAAALGNVFLNLYKSIFQSMTFQFYHDKTFEKHVNSSYSNVNIPGTYEFIHDFSEIILTTKENDDEEKRESFKVQSISNNKLVLVNSKNLSLTFEK